jgi:hypothetical protein
MARIKKNTEYPFFDKFCNIIDGTTLSDTSKKNYKFRLKRLVNITGKDVDWIMTNCQKTIEIMEENNIKEPQSKKALINSILTLFKHGPPGLKKKMNKAYKCWFSAFSKVNQVAQNKYDTLTASDKQVDVYVPWVDIIKKRDEIEKDSDAYLLLCLYTMIPPARSDLNKIKIFLHKSPSETDVKDEPNFLMINKDGSMKLVYNEFKSKSKKLQKYEKVLPKNLVEVIETSLKNKPRDYLIVSPRNGLPYVNANSFTKYFNRMLETVFGKKLTTNTLRHSFVNSINFQNLTPLEKEVLANDMMHSPEMFDRYRLIIPAEKSGTGRQQICEVVCRDA